MQLTGFDGRVALVTGAGSGIGEGIARALGASGARVAVTDVNVEAARGVAQSMQASGADARAWKMDVTRSEEVDETVAAIERDYGPIEHLVNVAGIVPRKPLLEFTDAEWDQLFSINTRGVFVCLRAVARRMVARGRGAVVTVGSQGGVLLRNELAHYGASKAAASLLTKCFGLEIASKGVRCNVVNPGTTETPPALANWAAGRGSREIHVAGNLANYRAPIPLGKVATTAEVAAAVMFLLSEQAGHITMEDIVVDGGATMIP
jgi:2,3-dihydro-2,3-dihydroxybenzoate dehydrogenase